MIDAIGILLLTIIAAIISYITGYFRAVDTGQAVADALEQECGELAALAILAANELDDTHHAGLRDRIYRVALRGGA